MFWFWKLFVDVTVDSQIVRNNDFYFSSICKSYPNKKEDKIPFWDTFFLFWALNRKMDDTWIRFSLMKLKFDAKSELVQVQGSTRAWWAHSISSSSFIEFQTVEFEHKSSLSFARVFRVLNQVIRGFQVFSSSSLAEFEFWELKLVKYSGFE